MKPIISSFYQLSRRAASNALFRYALLIGAVLGSYVLFLQRCATPNAPDNFLDLPSFYAASVAVFRDHTSPYNLARLTRINGLEFRTYPFLYPPASVLLFEPLAAMTLSQAKQMITMFNHITIIITLLLTPLLALKLSPRADYWKFMFCALYPLFSCPLILTIRYGQTNILALSALVGFWIAAQHRKSLIAGLCLSLAILCKTTPILFIPMLLIVGRWKTCVYALVSLALTNLASFYLLPAGIWSEWLFQVAPSGGYMNEPFGLFSPAGVWNQSLNGIIARQVTSSAWSDPGFHAPLLGKLLAYVGTISVITASAVALRRVHDSTHAISLVSAVTLPMIFIVAPFSWEHHGTYLIPAILFAVCNQTLASSCWRIPILVAAIIIAATFTVPDLLFYRFASVVSLWIIALIITWRDRSASPFGQEIKST